MNNNVYSEKYRYFGFYGIVIYEDELLPFAEQIEGMWKNSSHYRPTCYQNLEKQERQLISKLSEIGSFISQGHIVNTSETKALLYIPFIGYSNYFAEEDISKFREDIDSVPKYLLDWFRFIASLYLSSIDEESAKTKWLPKVYMFLMDKTNEELKNYETN